MNATKIVYNNAVTKRKTKIYLLLFYLQLTNKYQYTHTSKYIFYIRMKIAILITKVSTKNKTKQNKQEEFKEQGRSCGGDTHKQTRLPKGRETDQKQKPTQSRGNANVP